MPFSLDPYLSEPIQRGLIPAVVTAAVTIVGRVLSPRSKVKWGVSHSFAFAVQQQDKVANFQTVTVFVQNMGRGSAECVKIHFNYKPEHLQIWPTLNYTTETNPEWRFTLTVKELAPKEHFTLKLLSGLQLPNVLRIRSKAGEGKKVAMAPIEVFPSWVTIAVRLLLWLGFFSVIQNAYLWIYR